MKRKLILFAAFMMLGITSVLAEDYSGCVILEHNGEDTYFEAKDIQKAFDAAVESDVINISEGNFPEVSIKKLVNIKSNANINYSIEIPGNPSIDKPFIESSAQSYVTINSDLKNIVFSNATVEDFNVNSGVTVENVVFDRCFNRYFSNQGVIKKITANNSSFEDIKKNDSEAKIELGEFTNCDFRATQIDVLNAKYVNSILHWSYDFKDPFEFTNCTFTNCLMNADKWVVDESAKTNCWDLDSETFTESKDYLLSKGYLGTDGTVIGYYGGTTPYTGAREMTGPSPSIQNLNKKGNKMSPEYYIFD